MNRVTPRAGDFYMSSWTYVVQFKLETSVYFLLGIYTHVSGTVSPFLFWQQREGGAKGQILQKDLVEVGLEYFRTSVK